MSLACEAEIRVQNEFALRFSVISKPVPILEYIRTVSSLVGASHILAIFEENDSIKVFFDDKRYVDILIKSGIHVMGHHVRTDYVVPPGTKIILSNVDPVITNNDVMKLLSMYGTVVSPIIRPPISDDPELCHIGYGVRYVYMHLNGDIPNKIEFKYDELVYNVKVRVEDQPALLSLPYIKTDAFDPICDETSWNPSSVPGPSRLATCAETFNPCVVSVESTASESNGSEMHINSSALPKRSRGRPRKGTIKPKPISASSRAARRIKNNVKHKFMGAWAKPKKIIQRQKKWSRKRYVQRLSTTKKRISKRLQSNDSTITVSSNNLDDTIKIDKDEETKLIPDDISGKKILDIQNLLLFIDEVKGHRAPIELARKYIGENCDDSMIHGLMRQLRQYNRTHNDINLRNRIWRLIKTLRESM